MSSTKSKRQSPPRSFENYSLSYIVSSNVGLAPVSNDRMTYAPGTAGTGGRLNGNATLNLGFRFEFDGITYTNIFVSTYGFAVLIDPEINPNVFSTSDVLDGDVSENAKIKDSFTNRHVLLCPWYDELKNAYSSLEEPGVESFLLYWFNLAVTGGLEDPGKVRNESISSILAKLRSGIYCYPPMIERNLGGMKYHCGESPRGGKYTVVRWKSYHNEIFTGSIVSFDLVIYESGAIEFRYAPKTREFSIDPELYTYLESWGATCGIFTHGGQVDAPKYRDFGYELKKDEGYDTRSRYKYGGAILDKEFYDLPGLSLDPPVYAKYHAWLRQDLHWPGQSSFGAVFRFSPPQLRNRPKRSILNLRDSVPFLGARFTEFDDQNTVSFTEQSVEYPTMMPSNFIVDANFEASSGVTRLFQSGSIQLNRSVTPGLFDAALNDCLVEAKSQDGGEE